MEAVVRKLSRPAVFRGPLATHRVPEIVVFVEQVGYQRKSVDGKFFKEFRADELVTELARVRRIHDLTIEEARADFKQQFIDNWDDRGASSPSPGVDEIGHRLPRPAVFPAHNGAPRAARIAATAAGYRSEPTCHPTSPPACYAVVDM
jgi:hypothetical protein